MDKTSKKHNPKLQLVIAVMIMAALFLAELYVMINESHNIVLMVGIAVLILIALYFAIDAVWNSMNEKDIVRREQYDNIYRSEKASYMLFKKNFEVLSKQVKNPEGGQKEDNSAEIIKSQKAIAKAAMSRMNQTQDRLFIELNNLEASLNDNIRGLSEKLSGFQEEIERLADHIAHINEQAILEVSQKNTQSPRTETIVMPVEETTPVLSTPEAEIREEVTVPEVLSETEKSTSQEVSEIADKTEPVAIEETSIDTENGNAGEAEKELDLDDIYIDNLDIDTVSTQESDDDILSQLLAAEKAPVEEEIDAVEELAKAANEAPVQTPSPADNGGKMDQDDIAALIASMTGGDVAAPKEEPAPKPDPVDNNPNKMMTPEEIAALIAGM